MCEIVLVLVITVSCGFILKSFWRDLPQNSPFNCTSLKDIMRHAFEMKESNTKSCDHRHECFLQGLTSFIPSIFFCLGSVSILSEYRIMGYWFRCISVHDCLLRGRSHAWRHEKEVHYLRRKFDSTLVSGDGSMDYLESSDLHDESFVSFLEGIHVKWQQSWSRQL